MEVTGPVVSAWAVLVAAVWHMVLGALWYGPFFGKAWMRLAGMEGESGNAVRALIVQFIAAFLFAWVMAHSIKAFEDAYGFAGVGAGISGAFWLWLGFVATFGLIGWNFEKQPFKLYLIHVCYYLIWMLGAGVILGLMPA
jgi:hypothetical protein